MQTTRESFWQATNRVKCYREPLCYELAGTQLRLAVDWREVISLSFTSENTVRLVETGRAVRHSAYECIKMKEKLYFVYLPDERNAMAVALVMDLANGYGMYWAEAAGKWRICTLIQPDSSVAPNPLSACSRLKGHAILWRCAAQCRFAIQYNAASACRVLYTNEANAVEEAKWTAQTFLLRDEVGLFIATEPQNGESLMMMMDLNTLRAVGLCCPAAGSGADSPQPSFFSAYGVFIPESENARALLVEDDSCKYKHRVVGKAIYNPATTRPIPGGLKQYVYPITEELAGRSLDLRLEGQPPVSIRFNSATELEWAPQGQPVQQETYQCIKADDSVYLIVFHPKQREPAPCVTLVWDTETRLVTTVFAWDHLYPRYPRLVSSRACFGAENREGEALPVLRHHYTAELLGRRFLWHYTANEDVLHICFRQSRFRLGIANVVLAADASPEARDKYEHLMRRKEKYPCYEESVYYIRIREGLYLYSVIEDAMCKLLGDQGGGELLALVNTEKMCYIGRTFGLDAQENAGHDLVGAPGCELDTPDEVEKLPFPIYSFQAD